MMMQAAVFLPLPWFLALDPDTPRGGGCTAESRHCSSTYLYPHRDGLQGNKIAKNLLVGTYSMPRLWLL